MKFFRRRVPGLIFNRHDINLLQIQHSANYYINDFSVGNLKAGITDPAWEVLGEFFQDYNMAGTRD